MMQQMLLAGGVRLATAAYVDGATGVNSATIPAHEVGDLIVAVAFRATGTTPVTRPAGYTELTATTDSGATCYRVIAYQVATTTTTLSGTWTGATSVVFLIYRGAAIGTSGGASSLALGSTSVTYGAFTPSVTDGSSLILGVVGYTQGDTNIQTPPTGMVNRQNVTHAGDELSVHESLTGRYQWTQENVALTGTPGTGIVGMVEIKST